MLRKKLKIDDNSQPDVDRTSDNQECTNHVPSVSITFEMLFWEKIWKLEKEIGEKLMELDYKSSDKRIAAIYNPLDYAEELHCNYLKKYLKKAPEVLFLGN